MMFFDADKFTQEGKKFKLGGRVFEVPIVPALTSLVISQNAATWKFGAHDETAESRAVTMQIIATILNQRVDANDRVTPEWVDQHLDMRSISGAVEYLFSEPEKKNADAEEEPQDPQKQEVKAVE